MKSMVCNSIIIFVYIVCSVLIDYFFFPSLVVSFVREHLFYSCWTPSPFFFFSFRFHVIDSRCGPSVDGRVHFIPSWPQPSSRYVRFRKYIIFQKNLKFIIDRTALSLSVAHHHQLLFPPGATMKPIGF
jgi:hypothetical protein